MRIKDAPSNRPINRLVKYPDTLKKVIRSEPSILTKNLNPSNQKLIHLAAKRDCLRVVELIAQQNPDCLNQTDNLGRNILHLATMSGHEDLVGALIEQFDVLDINAQDRNGFTAAHHAAVKNNTEIFVLLYEKEAELDIENNDGNCPIHLAAIQGNIKLMEIMERSDPELLYEVDNHSRTIIHHAIIGGQLELVKWIVNTKKTDLILPHKDIGMTVLQWSFFEGQLDIVKFLLDHVLDSNVNEKDKLGHTPAHYAARSKNPEAIKYLIKKKASFNIKDTNGLYPVNKAISGGNFDNAKIIIEKFPSELNHVCGKGAGSIFELIEQRFDNIAKNLSTDSIDSMIEFLLARILFEPGPEFTEPLTQEEVFYQEVCNKYRTEGDNIEISNSDKDIGTIYGGRKYHVSNANDDDTIMLFGKEDNNLSNTYE